MTSPARRRIPWWSRLYLAIPRRTIVQFARRYVRVKALLGGPRRAQRRRTRLQPYADLVDWPVEVLEARRMVERTVEKLDEYLVTKSAFPLLPHYRLEHPEHLTSALAGGRGVIVGMEHLTFRKMVFGVIRSFGVRHRFIVPPTRRRLPVTSVRKKILRGVLARVDRSRSWRSTRQVREAFRLLADGQVAIIATDGRGGELTPVPFLGTTVHRPTGPARIALRTGAPIVLAFPRMEDDGELVVEFSPPITPRTDLPEQDAVADIMTQITQSVEPFLRARPWAIGVRFVRQLFQKSRGVVPALGLPDVPSPFAGKRPGEPTAS